MLTAKEEQIVFQLIDLEVGDSILEKIVEEAMNIFIFCASGDFCLQGAHRDTIVFGSTNRLMWNFEKGFHIDSQYCTSSFKKGWEEYKATKQ